MDKYNHKKTEAKWPDSAKASTGKQKEYDHSVVEAKWQAKWAKEQIYKTPGTGEKKRYVLDMFPYPSGASMHVGHLEGYVGTDILSRYFRMKGHSVLHPMGWDAFGLPAENYAIKTGIHPDKSTHENIKTFRRQLEISGMSYDWDKEIDTSSPEFYKWTQWIFIQLFKAGLAYKKKSPVNWCPKDETVLANEQVVEGKCERCDTEVIQKDMDQWFFKITAYADRLISGLEKIDWEDEVKRQQINWIGRKEGINIRYKVVGSDKEIEVFTTAPVNFGMTFLVLSPEHKLLKELKLPKAYQESVAKYIKEHLSSSSNSTNVANKSNKTKTGVFTGLYVANPINNKEVPVWVSDFVVAGVGTGAVQGCPGHDLNDFEFAQEYKLPIVRVIVGKDGDASEITKKDQVIEHGMEGRFINSDFLNGLDFEEGLQKTMDWFEDKGLGKRTVTYHIRDWLISRQRYWGCPIPMVYCEDDGWQPVPDTDLPVKLPSDVDFLPHGESPIARSETFQKDVVCPICGKQVKREVDTMDTYVDSSWYFMRFCDPKNKNEFASKENIIPVDDYVGGGHVVQHLLFARFFWKFLFDQGLIDKSVGDEPFLKLRAPGWILGPDSRKMSKRWGNVITPDDIIPKFGADTLRVYEMFMGPFDVMKPWSITGVEGIARFLGRVWRLFSTEYKVHSTEENTEVLSKLHQTIKKVGEDVENYKFNTAISSLMELVNTLTEAGSQKSEIRNEVGKTKIENQTSIQTPNISHQTSEVLSALARLMAPFAPHMMEEIWVEVLGMPFSIHASPWPSYDPKLIVQNEVTVVVQINGKVRASMKLESEISKQESEVTKLAKSDPNVTKWLEGQTIKKTIFISGKVINFVI
ncbi:MAG: leucine--tRNA ligase [Candidatus Woesebacteria bacterium]|nr:MAG: leucine--tRNA ligase [Candidatus Woesebacteria bacterium]